MSSSSACTVELATNPAFQFSGTDSPRGVDSSNFNLATLVARPSSWLALSTCKIGTCGSNRFLKSDLGKGGTRAGGDVTILGVELRELMLWSAIKDAPPTGPTATQQHVNSLQSICDQLTCLLACSRSCASLLEANSYRGDHSDHCGWASGSEQRDLERTLAGRVQVLVKQLACCATTSPAASFAILCVLAFGCASRRSTRLVDGVDDPYIADDDLVHVEHLQGSAAAGRRALVLLLLLATRKSPCRARACAQASLVTVQNSMLA